jgi:glycosyltransferase involved in cell wall biosynthesis
MRIAQLAPPLETVPPARYGGTERVISTLTEELVRRGHDVTLFGPGGSSTSARLVVTCQEAVWHRQPPFHDLMPSWSVVIGKLLHELSEFDVVHSHVDWYGLPFARLLDVPMVTTLHGRLDVPDVVEAFCEFRDVPLVSISNAQRAPVSWANFVATVYHGIELDEFEFSPERGEYLAFLGRVSPDKGLDTAIRVARRTGMPLKIAARMPLPEAHDPNGRTDAEYWEDVIRPMLGEDVELLGEVGGNRKAEFLRNAAALLFPIQWPEPFGLVMVEALACGTPVLALRNGSVPEVIRDGVTGFVGESEDDLVCAVKRLGSLDRQACRSDAEQRFSPQVMAQDYECVFERLIHARANRRIMDLNHVTRGPADLRVEARGTAVAEPWQPV